MIHTVRSHAKFKRFIRRLRPLIDCKVVSIEACAVGILESLWHAAATSAIRGDIGKFDDDTIAELVGWYGDAAELIDVLVECGWLDRHPEHRLLIHDWHDHAPNHVKGNAKKAGGFLTGFQAPPQGPGPKGAAPEAGPQRTSAPNLTKPNLTNSPLPPHKSPAEAKPQAAPVEEEGGEGNLRAAKAAGGWSQQDRARLLRLLRALEVGDAATALREAEAHGVGPPEVEAIIAHWQARPSAWPAGMLYHRIKTALPGEPPDKLWPEPSAAASKQRETQARDERHERQRAEAARQRAEAEAEKRRRDALESRWGEHLAKLPRDELRKLAGAALAGNSLLQSMFAREGLQSALVRLAILEHLETQEAAA